ncbi:MAG: 6-phosphofructokinase [Planctomycetes bacterium]|nr:6-phosphofructokinase [Planctomycetota bacterium]
MASPVGNALIGQSGGPTCVINQSLVGIVEAARGRAEVRNVYGAVHGIKGVLEERLIDLGRESAETLEAVALTPAAALRSVRKKPTREECEKALAVFQAHDIRFFFYIGGNDSAETAHLLNELAVAKKYDLRLFHVPKTIDNDLRVTDHCPGYGSAARFVACATAGDNLDNRSLPGIKVNIIMGRNAGWLTAASVLAKKYEDDGPHLVYVPERAFSLDAFVADVDRVYKALGRCVVSVSEGVHTADGKPLLDSKEVDSHGNAQLSGSGALGDHLANVLKARLGEKLRVRADTYGYLQRCFAGVFSEVDAAEAREVGRVAMREALGGERAHGSIAIKRVGAGKDYAVRYEVTELKNVAKETRPLDDAYIAGSNGIAPSFFDYGLPLLGKLPTLRRLSDFAVAKKLGSS